MVTRYLLIFILLSTTFFTSCIIRSPIEIVDGEFILEKPKFTLDYQLDEIGSKLIDTSAVYVYTQTESSAGLNFKCLKFYSSGDYILKIIYHELILKREDFQVNPNSGVKGKFEIFDEIGIKLEYYTPIPDPFTDKWVKRIRKGVIVGDTIKLENDRNFIDNYIRQEF